MKKLFHCTFELSYHFVFVTKYRYRVLTAEILRSMERTVDALCKKWDAELVEFNGEQDHFHLLLRLNPKTAPSVAANNLKTVTSRLLRKEFGKDLAKTYWKPVLWSRTYFVASCGGAPLDVIKAYIQGQARPEYLTLANSPPPKPLSRL